MEIIAVVMLITRHDKYSFEKIIVFVIKNLCLLLLNKKLIIINNNYFIEMDKIFDAMLYTIGTSIIVIPIFYMGSMQLMKNKKDLVASTMDHFTNNLFGNFMRPPTISPPLNPAHISSIEKAETPTEITSFFMKKKGV